VWRLDRAAMTGTVDLASSPLSTATIPLRPMLGRVAVAPEGAEAFGGLWPGNFGGNMDAADVREGTTVYLPVFHPGALFYFGDGHAAQGDGEVCGSGLETSRLPARVAGGRGAGGQHGGPALHGGREVPEAPAPAPGPPLTWRAVARFDPS
jgi:hypothetical protein